MSATSRRQGFTLVEVLASITVFSIVFLSGTACIAQLLLTQTMNYQHTVAGTAAMLLADWHVRRACASAPGAPDFLADTTVGANACLIERVSAEAVPWDNLVFSGSDFIANGPDADRVFSFASPTVTDVPAGAVLDLSEYQTLVVTVSPASGAEADSRMSFRQVSFWYLPAIDLAGAVPPTAVPPSYTPARPAIARFLGRYLIPDRYVP